MTKDTPNTMDRSWTCRQICRSSGGIFLRGFRENCYSAVPFDKTTTYQQGNDKGPDALIEASRNLELYDIETRSEVYLDGIFTAQQYSKRHQSKC